MLVPLTLRILEPEGTLGIRTSNLLILQMGKLRPREWKGTRLSSELGLDPTSLISGMVLENKPKQ